MPAVAFTALQLSSKRRELINYRVHNFVGVWFIVISDVYRGSEARNSRRAIAYHRNKASLPCDSNRSATPFRVRVITVRSTSFHGNSVDQSCVARVEIRETTNERTRVRDVCVKFVSNWAQWFGEACLCI